MTARRLVVVVPSIKGDLRHWQPLRQKLQADLADADWLPLDHGGRLYKTGSAHRLARRLCAAINARWVQAGGYDDVVLIGHCLGGLLLRQAYLIGLDRHEPSGRQPWVGSVSRLVLFAAMNRGIDVDRRWWMRLGTWLARVCPPLRHWLVHDLMRGSRFITNLRITWIREFDRLGDSAPVVVQLVGDADGLVTADDSTDVQQFPAGYQTIVPDATHYDLMRLDKAADPELRYALIHDAVLSPRPSMADSNSITGADEVIFILHGIRAQNTTWVAELERNISASAPDADVVTSGYGYFSAAKFALPPTRKKPLRWFQDAYAERLARNPRARFQFIGHSNGTYLLGRSLLAIPGMCFDRVVLVGSVLPVDYDWASRQRHKQVNTIRNDRSARDVPVGLLCSGLRGLGMRDIGTAGVDGFYTYDDRDKREVFYYPGGHSAPLASDNLPRLAAFVAAGELKTHPLLVSSVPAQYAMLSRAAPWLARAVAGLAFVGAAALIFAGPWSSVANGLAIVVALAAIFIAVDLA